ncbi:MAG: class I SAM-dependent methyltransferase, partial [Solirubrobacterales bacterium]
RHSAAERGVRLSNLHTARGRITLSGLLRLPAARRRARRGIVPERPWIVPATIGWLRRRIRRRWRVLELGGGRSTVWFARRAGEVLAFEDDPFWVGWARDRIAADGLGGVEVRELPVERFVAELDRLPGERFDLVVVDFLESPEADRNDAVRAARAKVRPGGYLLLDDSDRPAYARAYELLGGWRERRFVGVKDGWPEVCETAIFRRPR